MKDEIIKDKLKGLSIADLKATHDYAERQSKIVLARVGTSRDWNIEMGYWGRVEYLTNAEIMSRVECVFGDREWLLK